MLQLINLQITHKIGLTLALASFAPFPSAVVALLAFQLPIDYVTNLPVAFLSIQPGKRSVL